ncbi:hypothetical protein AX17_005834 [Amanita inopinata Kibby_2008]|nr:hypothetical protein AX17_005834 [Amanita inopinata Kibby_2008]
MDRPTPLTNARQANVLPFDNLLNIELTATGKYMTYLPHSGFHNQRIALENALVLSQLLNRTLLMPPIRLGRKPIRYLNYDTLSNFVTLSGKEGLNHCLAIPTHLAIPPECFDYLHYTHIPWDWLININGFSLPHLPIQQPGVSFSWIRRKLQLNDTDIQTLADDSPYQYQFLDMSRNASGLKATKYLEDIYIQDLAKNDRRLLRLGTLFGSSRLLLKKNQNVALRDSIRRRMSFSNPILMSIVNEIRDVIAVPYTGAHIRISDGHFEMNSVSHVHAIWWNLIRICYGYSYSQGLELERVFRYSSVDALNATLFEAPTPFQVHDPTDTGTCRGKLHTHPSLVSLNTPLFISTDVDNPLEHPLFSIILQTFPCVLFISDFAAQLIPLYGVRNENDGQSLSQYVIPFLDAMVVGHASIIATTQGSTFGKFIQDVLWKSYHGRDVDQKG